MSYRIPAVHRIMAITALLGCASAFAQGESAGIEIPKPTDVRFAVQLFAENPSIVHPVGIAFDAQGRLLVIESHTHFPPGGYKGLKHDRILALKDTSGDGKADSITTFFEGSIKTMDLAVHPDKSVYISPRNEIIRLRDTDGDGKADEKTRIVYLETKGNYPHNGLCGLTFDPAGNLYFGMGENLGADYTLIGSDGKKISDGAEGGNIFWCTNDGGKMRRVATGFWNPFGTCFDNTGRLFVTDNDPDSSPPCRLIHVVDGGNYGYQFRYGRSGLHPFQSWNGQLPGTLGMVAGTGEAPCEVMVINSKAWPAEYQGDLLVASWADHRIERYKLKPKGASFEAERQTLIQGGKDFRPVGLTIGPDGALYFSDWVLRDYKLHGKGRIWRMKLKIGKTLAANVPVKLGQRISDPLRAQSQALVKDATESGKIDDLLALLTDKDAFVATAARTHLAASHTKLRGIDLQSIKDPDQRIAILLAWRQSRIEEATKLVPAFLNDVDSEVRFQAIKWIADERLETFRRQIIEGLNRSELTPRMFMAYATAMARLEGRAAGDRKLAGYYFQKLLDPKSSPGLKIMALRVLPPNHKSLRLKHLTRLLKQKDPALRIEAIRSLSEHPNAKRAGTLSALAADSKADPRERTWAIIGLSQDPQSHKDLFLKLLENETGVLQLEAARIIGRIIPEPDDRIASAMKKNPQLASVLNRGKPKDRPAYDQTDAWLERLEGKADIEAGRRIFFHPQLAGCFRCHQSEGRGATLGPDLTLIARRADRKAVLESIVQPSKQVAPRYTSWLIETADGQKRLGYLQRQSHNEQSYMGADGKVFSIARDKIINRTMTNISLMPQNMVDGLTDQELRNLMAYLMRN
jgi:putative membrane-bound dehydrogenase-like protein